jgi:uncharacterized protein (DUF1800 family)
VRVDLQSELHIFAICGSLHDTANRRSRKAIAANQQRDIGGFQYQAKSQTVRANLSHAQLCFVRVLDQLDGIILEKRPKLIGDVLHDHNLPQERDGCKRKSTAENVPDDLPGRDEKKRSSQLFSIGGFSQGKQIIKMLPKAQGSWSWQEAGHLLNRAGFGGSPAEITQWHLLGREKAVEKLLTHQEKPGWMPVPDWADPEKIREEAREKFVAIREMRVASKGLSAAEADRKRREVQRKFQQQDRRRGLELQQWWLERMKNSEAPLREKMALFWHDHFATSVQKVRQPYLLLRQNQTFRENALGNFRKLTKLISRDAAMMLYLDLPGSKKGKPNENFAREVMELFTLGAGGYSEQDIREAARAFTGYEVNRLTGVVSHRKRNWDEGEKTFLGKTGPFDGEGVIDVIFQQQRPAEFLAQKLWEYFSYENPPEPAVKALGETLRRADYDLVPMLREIFLSKEFYAPHCVANQIKSPISYYLQLLKQLELGDASALQALSVQTQLGQILFAPPNVAGWDWGKAWINTNTLLARYRIAGELSQGGGRSAAGNALAGMKKIQGMKKRASGMMEAPDYDVLVPRESRQDMAAMVDSLIQRFFQRDLPDHLRDRFIAYATEKKGVVFTHQEVAELVHLMLSTPHYQLT